MYAVDGRDRVAELVGVPQASVGAPLPLVFADEHTVHLSYLCDVPDPDWDGLTVRVVSAESDEPVATVRFDGAMAHMFGPPNDEALTGHPLHSRGLQPYGAYEVTESSWIRGLERMNAVHPYHRPQRFAAFRHFVFAFHDSTFECIATGLKAETRSGPLRAVIGELARSIG